MFLKRLFPVQRSLKTTKKVMAVCLLVVFLFLTLGLPVVLAQGTPGDPYGLQAIEEDTVFAPTNLIVIIANLIRIFLGLLGMIAVLLMLYAGYLWMTAAGNPEQVQKAQRIIKQTTVGIIIILSAFAIVTFVLGIFGGGTTTPGERPIPTPRPPLTPWGIGKGPIEDVYPRPGQDDVPINTAIVVTFKDAINATTICNVTGDSSCDGEIMKNVEICMLDENNQCVDSVHPENQFQATNFANTTVTQTGDGRTFVFNVAAGGKYLGVEDGRERPFQVTLKNGIQNTAGEDIFSGLAGNQFAWNFETNGNLDLDPPEIVAFDLYPGLDTAQDIYTEASPATRAQTTLAFSGAPQANQAAKVNGVPYTSSNFSQTLTQTTQIPGATVYFRSNAGFSINTGGTDTVTVTVTAGSATNPETGIAEQVEISVAGSFLTLNVSSNRVVLSEGNSIFSGAYLEGNFQAGGSWTFQATPAVQGDRITIDNEDRFIFVEATENRSSLQINDQSYVTVKATDTAGNPRYLGNLAAAIANQTRLATRVDGSSVVVTAPNTGAGEISVSHDVVGLTVTPTPGTERVINQRTVGQRDLPRNHFFQINFNEPVNPVFLDGNIIVTINGTPVSDVRLEYSNNYKTIEVLPPETNKCGVSNCGRDIYCWILSPQQDAYPASVEIKAAVLQTQAVLDANNLCSDWGGSVDTYGRCSRKVDLECAADCEMIYYPLASYTAPDGVVDLAFNSFNGSFNTYEDYDLAKTVGIAEGQSCDNCVENSNDGKSGRNAYMLKYNPNYTPLTNNMKNESGGSAYYGDNFQWSFYISSLLDKEAPLITSVTPLLGGESDFRDEPIAINFNKVMRSRTLRPGWDKDTEHRYLVVETVSAGAQSLGYWISKYNLDTDADDLADETRVEIEHTPYAVATEYASLAGSGLESIGQNCFKPGAGPKDTSNNCQYNPSGGLYQGCVAVNESNPSSYGHWNCADVAGLVEGVEICAANEICEPFDETGDGSYGGSWIITLDAGWRTTNTTCSDDTDSCQGCCFGRCVASGS